MLKLTFKEKTILVIVIIGLILGSSESFVSCIPGVFSHMQVQVGLVLGAAGVFFYTLKRGIDWCVTPTTYESTITVNEFTSTTRSTGVGIESFKHVVNIPGTDQTIESIFTLVNKPKYIYPLHEGKPGTPSDPSLFNVFESFEVNIFVPFATTLLISTSFLMYFGVISYITKESFNLVAQNLPKNSLIMKLINSIYIFIYNLHIEQSVYKILLKYFPVILSIFLIVFMGNVIGLVPEAFSYTGHIGLTLTLSGMIFFGWLLVGIQVLKIHFFAMFIPHNVPGWLFPLMFCVELLSYCIRPFSLGIRLFANILSGHILLHIITANYDKIRNQETNGFFAYIGPGLSAIITLVYSAVFSLETGVAGLQAYIYALLGCLYLQENVSPRVFSINLKEKFLKLISKPVKI